MNSLILIAMLAAAPRLQQTDLIIYYNPTSSDGQAIKQQLTTDLVAVCDKWRPHERIMGLNAILEHEYSRRRIHKYFRVKFVESSDKLSFRIGAGNRVVVPEHKGADPREYPGYVLFYNYVVDVHYRDYFDDLRKRENDRIWRDWYRDRNEKRVDFVFNLIDQGYTEVFSEFDFEFESMFKDGKFYSLESLGWIEPSAPVLIPPLSDKVCPLNKEWSLPR